MSRAFVYRILRTSDAGFRRIAIFARHWEDGGQIRDRFDNPYRLGVPGRPATLGRGAGRLGARDTHLVAGQWSA